MRVRNPLCALAVLAQGLLLAATPQELWEAVRSAGLDPGRAVQVENLEIDMEQAALHLDHGVLVPARPIAGRTTEMVFLGQARFRMRPPDPLERAQLELFTDHSELDVTVDRAVVVLGSEAIAQQLLQRPLVGKLDEALAAQAAEVFRGWVANPERRGFGADAGVWQALLGDKAFQRFFVVWCRSPEVGEFYYRLDPTEPEQVTLGQFVAADADDLEEHRIRKVIQKAQRKGRFRQLRFEDLGDWDTWVSAALPGPGGSVAGSKGFESETYVLDVTVDPQQGSLAGRARIAIRSEAAGRLAVPLTLFSDMTVRGVEDAAGRPLAWVRSGGDLYVALDGPSVVGDRLTLSVRWDGKAFWEIQKGIFALADTYSWYPRVGEVDRATYEATLRWPKGKQLLASGRVIESGIEEGQHWERRELTIPASAFSFEVGEFDVRQIKAGHVDVTIGFSRAAGEVDKGAEEEILATLPEALGFLEDRFGPYPLDFMTVVTVPRPFSQGFPGFVSLSHYILWRPVTQGAFRLITGDDPGADRRDHRRETIAHELAHQWWGNRVGWFSYRDQWLSEALADFSATLFAAHKAERKSIYLVRHAQHWKASLGRASNYGRTVESLGPVVMGSRLNSSQSDAAYQAVVYDKGAVVFHMLAKALGPEPFGEMLKSLAHAVDNRVIDTATFLAAIEKMSGLDLDPFAERFIYGTGIPEVYYTYRFVPQDGDRWLIEGDAQQVATGSHDYTLRRTESGKWDVTSEYHAAVDVSRSQLVVPFQVSLAEAKDEVTKIGALSGRKTTTQTGLGGTVALTGEATPIRIPLDRKPEGFWLDQRGEILARFYCEQREPKRMLRYRAIELARAGRYDEAEKLYRKALEAPLLIAVAIDDPPTKKEEERLSRGQDAAIHIGLARIHVERGRDADAKAALDEADRLLGGLDADDYGWARKLLRARLDSRAGSYESAYDALAKLLYLDFPYREGQSVTDAARRQRFRSEGRFYGDGDDYALLAATAFETGHPEVAEQAAQEAEKRDADVGELRKLLPKAAGQ